MRTTTDPDRSALRRIARDPHSRRKFLALTGGTGASAALLAACGEDEAVQARGPRLRGRGLASRRVIRHGEHSVC